jgi:lipid-A-disaccharide synthase
MKLFFIAGERSGDLHGANLIKAIKKKAENTEILCWGGDQMQLAGAQLLQHYKNTAIMGVWEVLKNLGVIAKNLKQCKQDILGYAPDAVVLIDYGGFNMKIAKFCKQQNLKVVYYIAPKVWAWNTKRAFAIKKYVDKLLVILPFEVPFFENYNMKANYVGNPLMDEIAAFVPDGNFLVKYNITEKPIIALLAGSRAQEVKAMLPKMMEIADRYPDYQFVVAGVDNLADDIYASCAGNSNVKVIFNETYNLLHNAEAALVTSGTATLETALLNCPQVVCYSTGKIQYALGKHFIKVPYISLVNLIMGKETVRELIQGDFSLGNICTELDGILPNGAKRIAQLRDYEELRRRVGEAGASVRAADIVLAD